MYGTGRSSVYRSLRDRQIVRIQVCTEWAVVVRIQVCGGGGDTLVCPTLHGVYNVECSCRSVLIQRFGPVRRLLTVIYIDPRLLCTAVSVWSFHASVVQMTRVICVSAGQANPSLDFPHTPILQAWWRGVRQRRRYMVLRAEHVKARVEQLRREVDQLKDRRLWEAQTLDKYRPHVSQTLDKYLQTSCQSDPGHINLTWARSVVVVYCVRVRWRPLFSCPPTPAVSASADR